MNIYAAFCRAIDDGLFDEVRGADMDGAQRLQLAIDPFVVEGSLSEDQQRDLASRLDQRKGEHENGQEA
jgi:hypothetical protein